VRQRGKTRITIHIDDDVLEVFCERADAARRGYQTMGPSERILGGLRNRSARPDSPHGPQRLRRTG